MAARESHERGHLIGLAQPPPQINKVIIIRLAFKSVTNHNGLKDVHGNERFSAIYPGKGRGLRGHSTLINHAVLI